jgi:hypothetical protein
VPASVASSSKADRISERIAAISSGFIVRAAAAHSANLSSALESPLFAATANCRTSSPGDKSAGVMDGAGGAATGRDSAAGSEA